MLVLPHPDSDRIARALGRCLLLAGAWSGIIYRSAGFQFATQAAFLDRRGSLLNGGRWNSLGGFPALYGSLDPQTAMAETLAHNRYHKVPIEEALPRVFVAIRARLHKVLDLEHGKVRHTLSVSRERMLREPWREQQEQGKEALTQAIGRAAWAAQLEGLLVPSAQTSEKNLVIFPDKLLPASRLEIVNADQLPIPTPPAR